MDVFSLNSSIILVVTIGLWLVWVVPYALRKRHRPIVAQVALRSVATTDTTTADPAGPATSENQGMTMLKLRDGSFGSFSASRGASAVVPASAAGLRIRWDRMSIAGIGLIALFAALVTGVVSLVTTLPVAVPLVLLLVFVGTVAGLRALAVRDRRRKVDAAIDAAIDGAQEADHARARVDDDRPTPLFDAAAAEHQPATMNAEELREAARSLAASIGDAPRPERPAESAWQPVAVPRPTYVDAERAARPAPEPLQLPESPRPATRTSIRAAEAGRRDVTAGHEGTGQLGDLDEVLRRRRGA
ncbi:hypothetical protein GCM10011512_10450 [Tersicoccus solisilvae]|uniref:Uncharacterized protein n=1 Tax=Tersicoccus solisilvae TaxID=1882339 RepID=A0ABQ1P2H9_9MICC|nr:hypothetical protein [Tersicoccus solisilvae]GGC85515.1 hypothetical protein GCM10011512_10450 [Tersicoccus solisilvae]